MHIVLHALSQGLPPLPDALWSRAATEHHTTSRGSYFMDYLASMQKLEKGAHGYAGFFVNRCALALAYDCSCVQLRGHCISRECPLGFVSLSDCVSAACDCVHARWLAPCSLLDAHWKPGMTEAEGLALMDLCIAEIKKRFMISMPNYLIKLVDKNGTRVVRSGPA